MKLFTILFLFISTVSFSQSVNAYIPDKSPAKAISGMELIWQEEFDYSGMPDTTIWQFEKGFVRNNELQWYQEENAIVEDGVLMIKAMKVHKSNPNFEENSTDWKKNRKHITFTSSSINTRNSYNWKYATFIIRAKIDTTLGAWPAIWTLGIEKPWPSNGEIDIMEFYRSKEGKPIILANTAWGTDSQWKAKWDDVKIDLDHFTKGDNNWVEQFHIWKMEWTEEFIRIYLDDELLNETDLSSSKNPDGFNPFHQPHYLLLNLAIGGNNGGTPRPSTSTIKYDVDYVRIYQTKQ